MTRSTILLNQFLNYILEWEIMKLFGKSVYHSSLLGRHFRMSLETHHVADAGTSENVHNLTKDALEKRQVEILDIINAPDEYFDDKTFDLKKFIPKKINRGPLTEKWKNSEPVICAYKLATIEFDLKGLGHRIEPMLHEFLKNIALNMYRQVYLCIDEWIDLNFSEVFSLEKEFELSRKKKTECANVDWINRDKDNRDRDSFGQVREQKKNLYLNRGYSASET
ncbi:phosphatidylinositol transfer protein 1-like isoform X3 [Schistocerca gregaria]|uniref:phosphatidylinositol transfer protein 1-like isoform X2 n=1 Tax=Schistocerca gregaria TaxID=7010 RepID=UPI00211E3B13|nr:phosphatidylinositol transfer protein 1-like isoform X2 [Schistocerca gregaria]XP_049851572.1 phosphatidylinositol transfer protein 1-like isoform X3 [Schistocerca gregaria]